LRFVHTSDWHLGRTFHGAPLLQHQRTFLAWLLELALAREADLVVVAGDVYDRAVPPVEAVAVLDEALEAFAAAHVPVLLTSGNHDSAIRLGFGGGLARAAGVHLRTSLDTVADPVVLLDEHGEVGCYGIPYLVPDAAAEHRLMRGEPLARTHAAVLSAANSLVLADAERRGFRRTVVAAHAFLTGGQASDSERDIRVGGIADAAAGVLEGHTYVALGHLHGPQEVALSGGTARYSGSPLAYSFSERSHAKSVAVVELGPPGSSAEVESVPTPVPRPLVEVRGRLDDLVERGRGVDAALADSWVRAVITDPGRPLAPLERLREVWPHTVDLAFEPDGGRSAAAGATAGLSPEADPVVVCARFVEYVGGAEPDAREAAVLRAAVEAAAGPGSAA
jgi:exonuclease SbcD